ncbi:MAG TPA: PhnD/SsuA/transferrin family substrate-binding protein [Polyangiaceae bacterium]|jgi:phosphonate transport system substrate-binding protein
MGALRLGLIPRGDESDERERDFVVSLSEALSCDVDVHHAADYRVVLTGLGQGLVDFAWLPPLVAARAVRGKLAAPIAVAVRYGDTSYRTVLVALPGSPIRAARDLRGARVAWVDRQSASGYVVLRAALARAGVRLAEAFSQEQFVRSHAAVARAVLSGEVDVGATCAHTEQGQVRFARSPFAGDAGLSAGELRVVFEAGPIPSDIFAVRHGVLPRVRSALEAALMHGMPPRVHVAARALMHADGFAAPTHEHQRMLEGLIDSDP